MAGEISLNDVERAFLAQYVSGADVKSLSDLRAEFYAGVLAGTVAIGVKPEDVFLKANQIESTQQIKAPVAGFAAGTLTMQSSQTTMVFNSGIKPYSVPAVANLPSAATRPAGTIAYVTGSNTLAVNTGTAWVLVSTTPAA